MSSIQNLQSQRSSLITQNKVDKQKGAKKKSLSKSGFYEQITQFFPLLLKLFFSMVKLFCTILIYITMSLWAVLKPLFQRLWQIMTVTSTRLSINDLLKKIISVIESLDHKLPQFAQSILTELRERGRKKSIPFNNRKEFSSKQLKEMYTNPAQYLKDKPSNQVLYTIKQSGKKKTITYFVPTFLRVLLKNFTAIDLDKLEAEVNADLIITFVYGNKGLVKLPKEVANRLTNQIMLNFERDEALRLSSVDSDLISMKEDESKCYLTFTIRSKFHMKIQSHVFYTPFQRLDLLFPITIQQLTATKISNPFYLIKNQHDSLTEQQNEDFTYQAGVKFNYMDNSTPFVRLDFKSETDFGNYSLIQSGLETKYNSKKILTRNQQKKKKNQEQKEKRRIEKKKNLLQKKIKLLENTRKAEDQKILLKQIADLRSRTTKPQQEKKKKSNQNKLQPDYFQYSLFTIPIFKHPFASLVMIFLPLWSLAIINLGIFFQGQTLSERIGSIGGVMIAFIALIPLIRSQIPPNPNVMFVEYLVYAQILASFLCLVDSIQIRSINNYQMEWEDNIYYLLSLMIFLSQIIIISFMTLYHYAINVHNYELDQEEQQWKKDKSKNKFNHFLWANSQCDKKFRDVIQITQKEIQKGLNIEQWSGKLVDLKQQLEMEKSMIITENKSLKHIDRILLEKDDSQESRNRTIQWTDSVLSPAYLPFASYRTSVQSVQSKSSDRIYAVKQVRNQMNQEQRANQKPIKLIQRTRSFKKLQRKPMN